MMTGSTSNIMMISLRIENDLMYRDMTTKP